MRIKKNKFGKYQCPCCEFYTFEEKSNNTFQICEVCYWEDDGIQLHDPSYKGGANDVSLNQAVKNFVNYGAINQYVKEYVRPAKYGELPDE